MFDMLGLLIVLGAFFGLLYKIAVASKEIKDAAPENTIDVNSVEEDENDSDIPLHVDATGFYSGSENEFFAAIDITK